MKEAVNGVVLVQLLLSTYMYTKAIVSRKLLYGVGLSDYYITTIAINSST